jgi:rubrerythrin
MISKSTNRHNSSSTRKSEFTGVTGSLSDESPGAKSAEVINEALAAENRLLKRMLEEMEKPIDKDGGNYAKESSDEVETDVVKLNQKVKTLETMCKDERMKTMQMSKHLEAHACRDCGTSARTRKGTQPSRSPRTRPGI